MAEPRNIAFHVTKKSFEDGIKDCVIYLRITSSQVCYVFPEEMQPLEMHPILSAESAIRSAQRSIKKVGQFGNVKVVPSDELLKTYWDDAGNCIFGEHILEEMLYVPPKLNPSLETPRREITSHGDMVSQKSILTTLSNVEKNSAINRFDRGSQRAEDWLDDFEKECNRFEITSDEMKIRALRYFVKDASENWYKTCMSQLSLEDFAPWKTSFLSVFGDRKWSRINYALNFKYLGGSYTEYAIKKNKTARRN